MRAQPVNFGSDRELAEAVVHDGDEKAFRELYRRHTPRLLAFVMRLLARGESEAEDVVQETWIAAFEGLEGFQWNSSFSTWLGGIGLNKVRARLRKSSRSLTVAAETPPEVAVAPVAHETRIDLETLIEMLPDDHRVILVLHDVEGMKHREIAEQLNIPIGTSKTHLSKARAQLRALMSGRGDRNER
jgi:RNA polymerase sigma-70 factor (ECF subfamily)